MKCFLASHSPSCTIREAPRSRLPATLQKIPAILKPTSNLNRQELCKCMNNCDYGHFMTKYDDNLRSSCITKNLLIASICSKDNRKVQSD